MPVQPAGMGGRRKKPASRSMLLAVHCLSVSGHTSQPVMYISHVPFGVSATPTLWWNAGSAVLRTRNGPSGESEVACTIVELFTH